MISRNVLVRSFDVAGPKGILPPPCSSVKAHPQWDPLEDNVVGTGWLIMRSRLPAKLNSILRK